MIHTIVGAALLGGVLGVSFCEEPGWNVVWKDDFNGNALDMTSWTVVESQGDSRVRDACGRKENIQVVNGSLVITSKRETVEGCKYNFTTGAIQSEGKKFWQGHTRVCVSAKLPGTPGKAKGSWPAHWLMPNTSACWPTNGEIDILEMINGNGEAHGTYHWAETCDKGHQHAGMHHVKDWDVAFHEYSSEYSRAGVFFQVDSKQISASLPPHHEMYNVPYYAILQTALGGSWPGPVAPDTVFPMTHTIDYIVVSQKAGL